MYRIRIILYTLFCVLACSCSSQRSGIGNSKSTEWKMQQAVKSWLHTPYRYGGESKNGVDCSGLTKQLYKEVYGIELIHNSKKQFSVNCQKEVSRSKLKMGDLVFFVTTNRRPTKANISHVGLYLGDGRFVHATTRSGVTISRLDDKYYHRNWITGGRVKR